MESRAQRGARAVSPAAEKARPVAAAAPENETSAPLEPPEMAESAAQSPASVEGAAADIPEFARDACSALALSQEAMARGLEALSLEIVGIARSGIDRAAQSATDMLAVKTFSDAIDVNAGLARDAFETFVGGSARLSELGVKLARDAAQPLLGQLGQDWARTFRPVF